MGMHIRQARIEDAAGIGRVYVDGWRTTYANIIPQEYLATMSYEHYERHWASILEHSPEFLYVAEDDEQSIVGFMWGGRERSGDPDYQGELHALYVNASYRQHGLGRLLVQQLARLLLHDGISSMIVWVLAENSSRRFYERLGGTFLRHGPYYVAGIAYDDTAYGWTDISILL